MATAARRPRRRYIVIGTVLVLLIGALASARFYTDVLWFQEVGFSSVLWTSIRTQFLFGVAAAFIGALVVWLNLWIASRSESSYRLSIGGRRTPFDELDRYRDLIRPYLRWIRLGVAGFFGLILGVGAASGWETYLLWANRVDFGRNDPQFGRDIGFYMFELPFYDQLLELVWFTLMAALVLTVIAHLFNGSIRPEGGLRGVHASALAHISVLLGLLALTKAAQYWFGQYHLNFSSRGVGTGASYTDVKAQLPALKLLVAISIVSAILFIINIRFRSVILPLAAVGIWILTSVLAGGVWPAAVQYFSVRPQEPQREAPYIERNIEETRFAFGLSEVEEQTFAASRVLEPEAIQANQDIIQNVRVWDPPVLARAYEQLQAIVPYFEFPDVDVDRYEIDGQTRQVLLSARELSIDDLPEEDQRWANQHLQYTHGYGIVASLANEQTTAGQPSFLVKDVPGTVETGADELALEEPRIYYGEVFDSEQYSIVNSEQAEIDYPTEGGVERSNYQGDGGIRIGNLFQRLAFAVREADPNLVLSGLIKSDSRILIYRNVRDRVLRAAPFLALDRDPYPAVVEGRPVWILDAYTSSRWFPYSQMTNLDDIVPRSNAMGDTVDGVLSGDRNYVRNSVKVVVDAYDGTMKFHIIDEEDPLIQAWRGAFPDLFTDEEISDELREHLRYPEDLFTVQSEVYLNYHVEDTEQFYLGEAKRNVARTPARGAVTPTSGTQPSTDEGEPVTPTYLLFKLPGEDEQEFILQRPFTPRDRNNMNAMLLARSDPEHYGELVSLEFNRNVQVPGPIQVDNLINQDVEVSQTLTLLGQEGSVVNYGKQVILPIEDSLLYIQPLFVTAESVGIPELKKVAVVFGEEVAMENTLEEALAEVFGLEAPEPPEEPREPDEPSEPPQEPPSGEDNATELLERATRIYQQMQDALEDGDLERYAELEDQLGRILDRVPSRT